MPSATTALPWEPEALRALAVSLQEALAVTERELAARDAELHAKTLLIEKLLPDGAGHTFHLLDGRDPCRLHAMLILGAQSPLRAKGGRVQLPVGWGAELHRVHNPVLRRAPCGLVALSGHVPIDGRGATRADRGAACS